MDTGLRDWREKGAPTHTYPDQRGQSWTSIYTCLPWIPSQMGLAVILHKRNSGKEHKQKGEMSKPSCLILTTAVSQTFFIIIMIIGTDMLNKKHAIFLSKNGEMNILYKILSQT